MDPNRAEVSRVLSLIHNVDLPHPSSILLSVFVTEALHPPVAARYMNDRLSSRDGVSLVSDWIYIVESRKRPLTFAQSPITTDRDCSHERQYPANP